MFERILNAGWALAGLAVVTIALYEAFHPCGMRSFNADSLGWVDRCVASGSTP